MKDAAGNNHYSIAPFVCPRCEKPAENLIAGVCPHCKNLIETVHRKVLDAKKILDDNSLVKDSSAHFNESGEQIQTTADNQEGENLIHSVCAEFGINFNLATEIVAFAQQHSSKEIVVQIRVICIEFRFDFEHAAEIVSFIHQHFKNLHDSAAEEKLREFFERDKAATARGLQYPGDLRMYLRMMALRKGYFDIAGGDGIVSVSKKCGTKKHSVSKATAEKCFSVVESAMNLPQYPPMPLLPNQRTPKQKKAMKEAQIKIWHSQPTP